MSLNGLHDVGVHDATIVCNRTSASDHAGELLCASTSLLCSDKRRFLGSQVLLQTSHNGASCLASILRTQDLISTLPNHALVLLTNLSDTTSGLLLLLHEVHELLTRTLCRQSGRQKLRSFRFRHWATSRCTRFNLCIGVKIGNGTCSSKDWRGRSFFTCWRFLGRSCGWLRKVCLCLWRTLHASQCDRGCNTSTHDATQQRRASNASHGVDSGVVLLRSSATGISGCAFFTSFCEEFTAHLATDPANTANGGYEGAFCADHASYSANGCRDNTGSAGCTCGQFFVNSGFVCDASFNKRSCLWVRQQHLTRGVHHKLIG